MGAHQFRAPSPHVFLLSEEGTPFSPTPYFQQTLPATTVMKTVDPIAEPTALFLPAFRQDAVKPFTFLSLIPQGEDFTIPQSPFKLTLPANTLELTSFMDTPLLLAPPSQEEIQAEKVVGEEQNAEIHLGEKLAGGFQNFPIKEMSEVEYKREAIHTGSNSGEKLAKNLKEFPTKTINGASIQQQAAEILPIQAKVSFATAGQGAISSAAAPMMQIISNPPKASLKAVERLSGRLSKPFATARQRTTQEHASEELEKKLAYLAKSVIINRGDSILPVAVLQKEHLELKGNCFNSNESGKLKQQCQAPGGKPADKGAGPGGGVKMFSLSPPQSATSSIY